MRFRGWEDHCRQRVREEKSWKWKKPGPKSPRDWDLFSTTEEDEEEGEGEEGEEEEVLFLAYCTLLTCFPGGGERVRLCRGERRRREGAR